jgi:hypothetical protein
MVELYLFICPHNVVLNLSTRTILSLSSIKRLWAGYVDKNAYEIFVGIPLRKRPF